MAVCTCNGIDYVSEQLASIIAQSILPQEIVVCDDRSDDACFDIVKVWAEEVAKPKGISVRLIQNKERLGVTKNFEQACSMLSTDIIFLCDQDDAWPAGKIERLLVEFCDPAVMLVHSDARLVGQHLEDLKVTLFQVLRFSKRECALIRDQRFVEIYCRRNLVTGAASAFRRSLLEVAQPFPNEWVHDEWLAAIAASCGRVVMMPECTLLYRQHGSNAIGIPKNTREYIAHAWRRIRETSRSEFLKRRIRRLELWMDRIESLDGEHEEEKNHIKGALTHFRNRSQMTGNPISRLSIIWGEWRSGRYGNYSGGRRGVLLDLLYL